MILAPMAQTGEEAIGSMGNDAALPVLSDRPKVFYNYFKQLFAQVTNPPIDPIREELVMSLVSFIGPRPNLLAVDYEPGVTVPPMRLEVEQPILTAENMEKLRHVELFSGGAFHAEELDICYPAAWGANGMEAALASLAAHAVDAIAQGKNILILSDREVGPDRLPIPALLATAAVHEHLVKLGMRTSAGLVVETGSAREVHHFALLVGYGAEAIHPYLALETLAAPGAPIGDARAEGRAEEVREGGLQGALQGDVQDGHLDLPELLRRADLRGGRPAQGVRRQVLHRHRQRRRGHRALRGRRRIARACTPWRSARTPCSRRASTRAASTTTASAAKSTCGRRTRSRSSSTRLAPEASRRTRSTPR